MSPIGGSNVTSPRNPPVRLTGPASGGPLRPAGADGPSAADAAVVAGAGHAASGAGGHGGGLARGAPAGKAGGMSLLLMVVLYALASFLAALGACGWFLYRLAAEDALARQECAELREVSR